MSSSAEARTHLDGDVALGNLPHVEPNGGDHVFIELTTLQERWKGEGRGRGPCCVAAHAHTHPLASSSDCITTVIYFTRQCHPNITL